MSSVLVEPILQLLLALGVYFLRDPSRSSTLSCKALTNKTEYLAEFKNKVSKSPGCRRIIRRISRHA